MSQTYFAILTAIGEAKLANATALGTTLQLTQMGVGDGNGSTPLPNRSQTALVRENRRAPLNRLFVDPANASQIIAEQVIPEEIGGWWIREIGLYDTDGNLCAVANCPDTYKPVLAEGSGRTQVIRMVLIVSNTAAVQLKIDPAIVLATRGYVDAAVAQAAPAGAITFFGRASAPEGWLKANGAEISRATYAALFAAVGTTFGAGNGATTFKLPDLRGEFIRTLDDGRGVDVGRMLGSTQADAIQGHKHITPVNNTAATLTIQSARGDSWPAGFASNGVAGCNSTTSGVMNASVGEDSWLYSGNDVFVSGESRPRNIALLACIKY